jgi:hypothetical protein
MADYQMADHHRKLRSQGGTDSLANRMGVHHGCHNGNKPYAIHHDVTKARESGWIVASWDDPQTRPVLLPGLRWALLLPDGTYRYRIMGENNG